MRGCVGCLLALTLTTATATAQPGRTVVAKSTSLAGRTCGFRARLAAAILRVLSANVELATGDLLVALPGASLEPKDGSVTVKSLADYDNRSPLPILETALTLGPAREGAGHRLHARSRTC